MKTFGIRRRIGAHLTAAAMLLIVSGGAMAGEANRNWKPDFDLPKSASTSDRADSGLPGVSKKEAPSGDVDRNRHILDDEPAPSDPNSWRVGDWDITISGSIRYQMGFSDKNSRK